MKKHIPVLLLYALLWSFLMGTSKVSVSGFHFVDDHEVYAIHDDILRDGFNNTLIKWIKDDFSIRFRPLYYVLRVIQVRLFQDNFLYYYIVNTILAILTSFFLYLFAFNIKIRQFPASIFPLFVLLGVQAAVWYRLGPAETPGIFFLSIALWMCSCAVFSKHPVTYEIPTISFMLLSSLCKESFLIFIPGLACLYVWLMYEHKSLPLKSVILKKLPFIAILLLICLSGLFIIVNYIGTNTIGYAGVD